MYAALRSVFPYWGGVRKLERGPDAGQLATFCLRCGSDARVFRDGGRIRYLCLGQRVPAGPDLDGVMRPAIERPPCDEREIRAPLREVHRAA
jgi:hypothetical protein